MWSKIVEYAVGNGISLPSGAENVFAEYYRLLTDANRTVNLTRITCPQEVMIKHFLDSIMPLNWCQEPFGSLLDVGSGAGFPGIPLKIARPELRVFLLDSARKKVDFLNKAIEALHLTEIRAVQGRAEDLGRQQDYRDNFDLVVSRALAPLNILLEYCLPFVRKGGLFIAYKGSDYIDELSSASFALLQLKSSLQEERYYNLPGGLGERALLIFKKDDDTPKKYPRRAGTPNKRPL